jgi:hypothetical protein
MAYAQKVCLGPLELTLHLLIGKSRRQTVAVERVRRGSVHGTAVGVAETKAHLSRKGTQPLYGIGKEEPPMDLQRGLGQLPLKTGRSRVQAEGQRSVVIASQNMRRTLLNPRDAFTRERTIGDHIPETEYGIYAVFLDCLECRPVPVDV